MFEVNLSSDAQVLLFVGAVQSQLLFMLQCISEEKATRQV